MHKSAYQDAERFVRKYLTPGVPTRIIDIGSMDVNGSLRPLFQQPGWTYRGADIEIGRNVDIRLPASYDWPNLDSNCFDVAVSSQVLEHVPHPWRWIGEVARIIKPGGLLYLCTPNTIHFHPYPIDCYRFWPDGLKAVVEEPGSLLLLECYHKGMDTTAIARKK